MASGGKVHEEGKEAAGTFKPVRGFGPRATLVEVEIHTGRTHQIRVHAAYAGHQVAGDEKYGDREFNARMKAGGLRRMFLHAQEMAFTWPDTGSRCRIVAALPADLNAVLEELALASPIPWVARKIMWFTKTANSPPKG